MDTTSFISTLTQAKQDNTQAQELLIHKFLPLIRKYAYKCHAMEFEDAQQELILAQYMKSLSPTRQRILQYALIDEYSSSEIAAKMQLSVQYVNRIKKEFLAERRKFT